MHQGSTSSGRAAAVAAVAVACGWAIVGALACGSPRPGAGQGGDGGGPGVADAAGAVDAAGRVDAGGPIDAAPPPDAFVPECTVDADCGDGRGCRAGLCRDACALGFYCGGAASGSICQDGLCVECATDADCDSGRTACDARSTCAPRSFDPGLTRFGIMYSTWHCRAAHDTPVHDISLVRAGAQRWGGYGVFHYWGKPAAGYYCLSEDDALLRQHAEQLRDAGIDFVFLDATNHAYVDARSDDTPGMILGPLDRLLAVWSQVPGAPRVVPWVPVVGATGNPSVYTVDAMLQRLAAYPGMQLVYLGKPLVLITANAQYPVDTTREAALAADYTVRRMWGVYGDDGAPWSFMQACASSPTDPAPCDQRVAISGGHIEQIPVAAAYQQTYMSVPTATPKHHGLTFRKQFARAFQWPETPIVTITGWNEWIAQRQRCGDPACPCATYPDGCFIDQWDVEYSRDLEPGANELGDYYYRLLRACISLFRAGDQCDAAHADDLCCHDWTP